MTESSAPVDVDLKLAALRAGEAGHKCTAIRRAFISAGRLDAAVQGVPAVLDQLFAPPLDPGHQEKQP
jgi:hypothetical protein